MKHEAANSAVVAETSVQDIRLVAVNADAQNYADIPDPVRIEFGLGDFRHRWLDDTFQVQARALVVFGDKEINLDTGEGAIARIELLYEVDLRIPEHVLFGSDLSHDLLQEIFDIRVGPTLFPYVRAKVHTLSTELPLPETLIPLDIVGDL